MNVRGRHSDFLTPTGMCNYSRRLGWTSREQYPVKDTNARLGISESHTLVSGISLYRKNRGQSQTPLPPSRGMEQYNDSKSDNTRTLLIFQGADGPWWPASVHRTTITCSELNTTASTRSSVFRSPTSLFLPGSFLTRTSMKLWQTKVSPVFFYEKHCDDPIEHQLKDQEQPIHSNLFRVFPRFFLPLKEKHWVVLWPRLRKK